MDILSKVFSFLKEKSVLDSIKNRLGVFVLKHKDVVKVKIQEFIDDKGPEAKAKLIEFVSNNIKLSFPLNLFKKTIIKTIDKNFTEIIVFITNKIAE